MATPSFDTFSAPPRRQAARSIRRAPAQPVARTAPAADHTRRRFAPSTVLLVGAIAALHAGVVRSLAGSTHNAPAPAPITISLAPPPKVEPPPPPPPPKPEPPTLRPRVAAPRLAAAPVVAPDTPLVAATADTVQVARAPVEAAPEPAPAPAPKPEEPVTEPKGYAGYLHNPAPDYPPAAQKRGLEGKVVLKVHVLASGQPDNVTVAKSSGHQILDEAALKAVTQWAFAPAHCGQTPIDGWVQVPLTFKSD